ncbi:hypothetical protein AYO49_04485 [Verrucomicrobiaceae bacterium SCGC AG-212-N21]|nr:hypothetical protein AYO49_04485 [Verrucomicrobiaceae bacterium SCGC AG-212-N21]
MRDDATVSLSKHSFPMMTWQEYQTEMASVPVARMPVELLAQLAAFSLPAEADAHQRDLLNESKHLIHQEIARRNATNVRREEESFRRQERHQLDRQHLDQVAQSSRMHVAQMERAHATFVFHRRFIWIASLVAIASALLAWFSLWTQRQETQRALHSVRERLEALETKTVGPPR